MYCLTIVICELRKKISFLTFEMSFVQNVMIYDTWFYLVFMCIAAKEAVKKTVSKTSSNTIKVNKTQGRTITKTKVTDVKGQTQKPENCQTDKKSGDMRPRPTQKTRDNKRDKPAAGQISKCIIGLFIW